MARLDVEYTERAFEIREKNKVLEESQQVKLFTNIEEMTKEYEFNDTNDFLLSLETDIKLPNKTRDIYLYLPYKMLNIYPTVNAFSNIDLMSGKKGKTPFFFISRNFKETKENLNLGNGVILNKKDGTVSIGNQKLPLRRTIKTFYDKNMKLQKNIQVGSFSAQLNLIYS